MGCYCILFIFIFKFYWPFASDGFFCEQSWKLKANRYNKHTGAKQLRWVVYSFLLILYTYFATSSNFIYSQDGVQAGVQVIAVYLTNHRRCSSFTAIQYCAPLYFTVSFVFSVYLSVLYSSIHIIRLPAKNWRPRQSWAFPVHTYLVKIDSKLFTSKFNLSWAVWEQVRYQNMTGWFFMLTHSTYGIRNTLPLRRGDSLFAELHTSCSLIFQPARNRGEITNVLPGTEPISIDSFPVCNDCNRYLKLKAGMSRNVL